MSRLISLGTIQEKLDRSKSWLWARIAAKDFPAPVVRGSKALWLESEVDRWMVDFVAKERLKDSQKSAESSRTAKARRARAVSGRKSSTAA